MNLDLTAFAWFHTILSLIAIVAGFPAMAGLKRGGVTPMWTELFLATAVATNVTGFMFPLHQILPSHIIGGLSLVVLALALVALYQQKLAGSWRTVYAVNVVIAQYFLIFVLIAQAFNKVFALQRLAPTQSEPPFAIAQAILLAAFVYVGWQAVKGFKSAGAAA